MIPQKILVGRTVVSIDRIESFMINNDKKTTAVYKKKLANITSYSRLPLQEIDNTPLHGFRIIDHVNYKNCSFYIIEHPYGYTFKISSANMMDLMRTNDIIDVEFKNPLYFDDKFNLINTDANIFKNTVIATELAESIREQNKGFIINEVYADTLQYIGRFHVIYKKMTWHAMYENSSLSHVFYDIKSNTFKITYSPKSLLPHCTTAVRNKINLGSPIEVIEYFNNNISELKWEHFGPNSYLPAPLIFSTKKIMLENVRVTRGSVNSSIVPTVGKRVCYLQYGSDSNLYLINENSYGNYKVNKVDDYGYLDVGHLINKSLLQGAIYNVISAV